MARRGEVGVGTLSNNLSFAIKVTKCFPAPDDIDRPWQTARTGTRWRLGRSESGDQERRGADGELHLGPAGANMPHSSHLAPCFCPTILLGQASCCELRPNHCIIICLITNSVRSHDTRSWSEPSDLGLAITLFSPLMITGAVSPLSRVVCRAAILTLSTPAAAPPGTIQSCWDV